MTKKPVTKKPRFAIAVNTEFQGFRLLRPWAGLPEGAAVRALQAGEPIAAGRVDSARLAQLYKDGLLEPEVAVTVSSEEVTGG